MQNEPLLDFGNHSFLNEEETFSSECVSPVFSATVFPNLGDELRWALIICKGCTFHCWESSLLMFSVQKSRSTEAAARPQDDKET